MIKINKITIVCLIQFGNFMIFMATCFNLTHFDYGNILYNGRFFPGGFL